MEEKVASCCAHQGKEDQGTRGLRAYLPLIVIGGVALLASAAKQVSHDAWNDRIWMRDFMGILLVIFSMVKLFDLPGFIRGFARYDLLAAISTPYAACYPFLELTLGLGYLSGLHLDLISVVTMVVFGLGTLGVLRAIVQGRELKCACMGAFLDVPVSVVTLGEDLLMILMAAFMWLS